MGTEVFLIVEQKQNTKYLRIHIDKDYIRRRGFIADRTTINGLP